RILPRGDRPGERARRAIHRRAFAGGNRRLHPRPDHRHPAPGMIFAEMALAEAEGALLAHSVKLKGGAFKKGRRLSAADIAALAEAGHSSVMAVRLEPDDVPEDEAARAVAEAVAGDHLTV